MDTLLAELTFDELMDRFEADLDRAIEEQEKRGE